MKRRTLRERAEAAMPLVWRGSVGRGKWQPEMDMPSFVRGYEVGYRNGVKDGRKQAKNGVTAKRDSKEGA